MSKVRLKDYNNDWFERGRPALVELAWILASVFVSSSIPGNALRVGLLRLFGARIGKGVVIKPGVKVKFPWRLSINDDSWIGEGAWLDSLVQIDIGANCCLSQGVYVCTGNHDWSSETFDLVVKPVSIEDGAWIGAFARIAPGVTIRQSAVVAMGAVITADAEAETIYAGNPAAPVKTR